MDIQMQILLVTLAGIPISSFAFRKPLVQYTKTALYITNGHSTFCVSHDMRVCVCVCVGEGVCVCMYECSQKWLHMFS